MNLERLLYREALPVVLGVQAAQSDQTLPRIWFDALAEHEAQIDALAWESNSSRAEARALRKLGA